jgi:SHS2 domain-containing protein
MVVKMEKCFGYEEHTADVIVVAWGDTLERAFECAAIGVSDIMVDRNTVEAREEKKVVAEGFDLENLLYKWIEELIFLFDSERFLAKEAKVFKIKGSEGSYTLDGSYYGESYDPLKHDPRTHVKAVTYSLMKIWRESGIWKVKFTIDI